MAPKPVRVTIKYSVPGTQPPVYLAGSFTDPPWLPYEMQHNIDEKGECEFTRQIEIEEGKEYQYKYRIGDGDWWILNEDSPTVTDGLGNRNNLLLVPVSKESIDEENTAQVEAEERVPEQEPSQSLGLETTTGPPPVAVGAKGEFTDKGESPGPKFEEHKPTSSTSPPTSAPHTLSSEAVPEAPFAEHSSASPPLGEIHNKRVEHTQQEFEGTTAKSASVIATTTTEQPESAHNAEVDGLSFSAEAMKPSAAPSKAEGTQVEHVSDGVDPSRIPLAIQTSSISADTSAETQGDAAKPKMRDTSPEEKIPSPVLIVEKSDSSLRFGDDYGARATFAQRDAHHLRAEDAEPDYVVVRHRTPEIADTAAEVADSAAILDPERSATPISDEEAGRIGYRRMSHTPIPQVADTAAEVADAALAATLDEDQPERPISDEDAGLSGERRMSHTPIPEVAETAAEVSDIAATLDKDKDSNNLEEVIAVSDEGNDASDQECGPPFPENDFTLTEEERQRRILEDRLKMERIERERREEEEIVIDPNDPRLEYYTSEELVSIIQQLIRMGRERGIPTEVAAQMEVVPANVTLVHHADHNEIKISPSPSIPAQESLPSLDSIEEATEGNDGNGVLTKLPSASEPLRNNGIEHVEDAGVNGVKQEGFPPVERQKADLESPTLDADNHALDGVSVEDRHLPVMGLLAQDHQAKVIREVSAEEEGPNITVQPATPGSSTKTFETDHLTPNKAKSTAIEEENGESQLTSRKQPGLASPDRSNIPASIRSASKVAGSRNFLKVFWRVVIVEWIGGFIMRLCGGGRRKTT